MKSSSKRVNGPTKELFTDGGLSGEGHLKDGKRHGKWQFYYYNGRLKAVAKYQAGDLERPWEWWRENGQPLQAGAFKNGKQVGLWRRYYENGQLWDEGSYEEGKKFGEWKTYDKSGALKQAKTFKLKKMKPVEHSHETPNHAFCEAMNAPVRSSVCRLRSLEWMFAARFRKIFLRRVSHHPLLLERCRQTLIPSCR